MSGVSAFKNAVRRRIHKERAQPYARQKLGILEKHKDYKLRAKDYHRKQDEIDRLKKVASFKNPDEFYHKMKSTSTIDGVHATKRDNTKDQDTITQWKLQDSAWLQMKLAQTSQKIDKMQHRLQHLAQSEQSSKGEYNMRKANKRMLLVDEPDSIGQQQTALKKLKTESSEQLQDPQEKKSAQKSAQKLANATAKEYREFGKLVEQKKLLSKALAKITLQRKLMASKGTVRKIVTEDKFGDEDKEKTVYKWKLQRAT